MSITDYVRLTPDTDNLSFDVISSIRRNQSFSIYGGIQKNILPDLIKTVKEMGGMKLVMILEEEFSDNGFINGLDILEFLPSVEHLAILAHKTNPLANIDAINYISNLKSFSISGYLKKNMDLSPLGKFNEISNLHIDNLIFQDKYNDILNRNPIECLSLRKIDLSGLNKKSSLQNLTVLNELAEAQQLAWKFPNIRELSIINGKKLLDFSFLSDCLNLARLDMNTVKGLTTIPNLKLGKLHTLQMFNCQNLENIDYVYEIKNLKNLAITFSKVNLENINRVFSKLSLQKFYFVSNKNKENLIFKDLASKYNVQCIAA